MKRSKSTTRQRGIALMMTLGVLALLLIMALAFAYTTRTERLAAGVNTDLIRARLLAESGVERAIAFLREQYAANPAPGTQFYVPTFATSSESAWVFDSTTSPPGRGGRYLGSVSLLKSSVDLVQNHIKDALASTIRVGTTAYQFTPASKLHDAVGWIPITVNHGAGTESCIGLVAYLVIDETGKIDPSLAVGGAYGITPTPTEDTSTPDTRLGLYPGEISMSDVFTENNPDFSYGSTLYGAAYLYGNAFQLRMSNPGRWDSLYNIMNRFKLPTPLTLNQAWVNRFIWSLRPFSVEEPEAYSDTAGGALNWRCDINAIDWNTMGIFPTGLVAVTSPYSASVGIPWFGKIDASVRDQVTANFIDYMDADVEASGAGVPATDTQNNYTAPVAPFTVGTATYVGCEDVPYINEVWVRGTAQITPRTQPGLGVVGADVDFTFDGAVELINVYQTVRALGCDVDLCARVTLTASDDPANPREFYSTCHWGGVSVASRDYTTTAWATSVIPKIAFGPGILPVGGSTLTLSILDVRVAVSQSAGGLSAATLWDCADLGTCPKTTVLINNQGQEISAGVNDPRCNTAFADGWSWGAFTSNNTANPASGTPGVPTGSHRNTECVDPGNGDTEGSADPVTWSTPFIRNGAVVSFWELGAISRGKPWQTLNLHGSDQTVANVGLYSYGDWPLLNQVKLTLPPAVSPLTSRGGINVWSVQPPVWKPLLQGVRMGTTYLDPNAWSGGPGTELINNAALVAAAADLAGASPTWTNAAGAVFGRAAIVRYDPLTTGGVSSAVDSLLGARGSDALREEAPCKLVGLLNDRISYYTIIVCAKAVQDVGGLPAGMTAATCPRDWIEYLAGRYCRPMAEQKVMALVWRDAATNQFRIASFEYLED